MGFNAHNSGFLKLDTGLDQVGQRSQASLIFDFGSPKRVSNQTAAPTRAQVSSIGAYHALKAREPECCERAYPEFLGLYDQMTRKPLRAVD